MALFFCKSREKDNEEKDAKDENGNDERAAGMLGGGIRRGGGGSAAVCKAWLLQQQFTILMKYKLDCSTSKHCHYSSIVVGRPK